MILFQQIDYSFVIEFVILRAGLKLKLSEPEKHSVVNMETDKFAVGIFGYFLNIDRR